MSLIHLLLTIYSESQIEAYESELKCVLHSINQMIKEPETFSSPKNRMLKKILQLPICNTDTNQVLCASFQVSSSIFVN